MNKDIIQKQKAIRFCVANGLVPYLEVIVRYLGEVTDVESDISDIDVLGLRLPSVHRSTRTIFDCKTLNRVGAISRAMWAAGLMRLIHANEAYVILNKTAPEGHRLAANNVGVRLTSEILFDNLGQTISPIYAEGFTYLDNIEAWNQISKIGKNFPGLQPMLEFLWNKAPLERDATRGFRTLISVLKKTEGEFDNSKPEQRVLWGLLVCEAIRFLSEIVFDFYNIFDPEMNKSQFEKILRNYIWGSRESYIIRQKLHTAMASRREERENKKFDLPAWDGLVELIRSLLDAPHMVGQGVVLIKDLTISELSISRPDADQRIKNQLDLDSRTRQFALQTNRYLGSLSRLLRDCSNSYSSQLMSA